MMVYESAEHIEQARAHATQAILDLGVGVTDTMDKRDVVDIVIDAYLDALGFDDDSHMLGLVNE